MRQLCRSITGFLTRPSLNKISLVHFSSSPFPKCISCGNTGRGDCGMSMIRCKSCGFLLPKDKGMDYYSLFCAPPSYVINNSSLRHQFIKLQRLLHPDNFSSGDERLQALSAEWSSFLNKAYETLKDPQKRARYLYELKTGEDLGEEGTMDADTSSPEIKTLLAEVMDTRLELEDCQDPVEVNSIIQENEKKLAELYKSIEEAFSKRDISLVRTLLVKLRYLRSIDDVAKDVLENLR